MVNQKFYQLGTPINRCEILIDHKPKIDKE